MVRVCACARVRMCACARVRVCACARARVHACVCMWCDVCVRASMCNAFSLLNHSDDALTVVCPVRCGGEYEPQLTASC